MVTSRLPELNRTISEGYTSRLQAAISKRKVAVLDIETDGLEANTIWVVGVSCCYGTEDMCMLTPKEAYTEIPTRVNDGWFFVIHNAKFDVGALRKHGIHIPYSQVVDSMLLSYIRNPGLEGGHSLENLGPKMDYRQALIDAGLLGKSSKKGSGDEYRVPSNPVMYQYCATDLRVTRDSFLKNIEMIERDPAAWALFSGVEMPFLELIDGMEHRGMQLNKDLAVGEIESWKALRETLAEVLQTQVGFIPGEEKLYKRGYHKHKGVVRYNHCKLELFNPASNQQIGHVLQRLGWEPSEFTKTGQPKVDAQVLSSLKGQYDLVDSLLEISRLDKMIGMVQGYLDRTTPTNTVHGSFNQCFTLTGRLSSSNPNLQNVPTRGKDGATIRSMFTTPPGYSVVGNDLSNIEGRVLAHLLSYFEGEERLAQTFKDGVDFHQANANAWDVIRGDAKTLLYAAIYGAGPAKVGNGNKKRGQELLDMLDRNMPAINRLKRRVWSACRSNKGLVHTWFGRRLYYPDINSRNKKLRGRAERQVFNGVLQGTAADILKMILVAVEREVTPSYDGWLVAQVHDEGQWYVRSEQAKQFALDIEPYFAYDYLSNCPTCGESKVGNNWNEVH